MTYDAFYILHDKSQLRMFLNSKNEVFLELGNDDKNESISISLSLEEAKQMEIRIANLIVKMIERHE